MMPTSENRLQKAVAPTRYCPELNLFVFVIMYNLPMTPRERDLHMFVPECAVYVVRQFYIPADLPIRGSCQVHEDLSFRMWKPNVYRSQAAEIGRYQYRLKTRRCGLNTRDSMQKVEQRAR